MDLRDQAFILVDFQTTGTKADESYIIEAGWGLYRACENPENALWYNHQILLPPGEKLPLRIQRLTGLSGQADGEGALSYAELGQNLGKFLSLHTDLPVLIHFARFKLPFLEQLIRDHQLSCLSLGERVICTYQLSKTLLPQLKSYTLRAIAGYADYSLGDKKRTREHLLATASVWQYLSARVQLPSSTSLEALPLALSQYQPTLESGVAAQGKTALHSTELRAKRLALPLNPGIYFFLDRSGRILYVGKARQLKARVNSYFRGRKTKGSRLNELLTRTTDLRVQVCNTELEALLQESDAIKRHNPPYNILLTEASRGVHWLVSQDWIKTTVAVWGPFSSLWSVKALEPFIEERSIPGSRGAQLGRLLGRPPLPDDWLDEALAFWLQHFHLAPPLPQRESRAQALYQLARALAPEYKAEIRRRTYEMVPSDQALPILDEGHNAEDFTQEKAPELTEDRDLQPEDIVELLWDTLGRLSYQIHRARWLLRLMDAEILWSLGFSSDSPPASFRVRSIRGEIEVLSEEDPEASLWGHRPPPLPHRERRDLVKLAVYDRMMILYTSLKRGLQRGDRIRLALGPHRLLEETALKRFIF